MAERIIFLRVIKTIVGLLGIFGNALVCLVIYKIKSMHTTTNAFIFNQAAIDFLGSTMLLLSSNIPTPSPVPDNLAGGFLCRLWISNFFLWSFLTASTLNLVSLTFERYVAIVFPFKHGTIYGEVPVRVLIAAAWIIGTASSFYDIAFYDVVDGTCQSISVPGSEAVGVMIFLLQYLIPVCAMLVAYIHIIVVLKQSASRVAPPPARTQAMGSSSVEAADASLLRARRNTFKTLLIVFITYVVCWTLNSIIFFMFNFGYPLDFNGALYIISVALVAINSCANPVIYAVKYRQFRRGLRQLLGLPVINEDVSTSGSGA
ncbi:galanin receptor 2b-like [Patiria miniata]|uniref:G-protein coupled receptors family 1 profile domain-containing protein n=1 Tax=Patiria miniata TaxID=46514 RepID=A0A913ZMZ8_PATMI|nr:galanin receptor 2b-like [Patiria miniata]